MVGVHGCDHGSFRMQVQERAVEFIGLGYDDIVVTQQKVGAVVLGDAAQKRRAAFARLGEDVGQHGAGGRLAVSTGDSQTPLARGYLSEGLCPFYYAVAVCPDVDHLSHVGRHGRCVDDQSLLRCRRYQGYIAVKMHRDALFLQGLGHRRRCPVVSGHIEPGMTAVPGYRAHADASDAYEIYVTVSAHVHVILSVPVLLRL